MADVDRNQAPPAVSSPHDVLEGLAVSLAGAYRALEALDRPHELQDDEMETLYLQYKDSLLERATFARAASPLGAFVQLLSLKSQLEDLVDLADDSRLVTQQAKARAWRLIYSLSAFFEAAGGFSRRDFAFDWSMPERLDLTAQGGGIALD